MPLQIVHSDITKLSCDVIVCPTDCNFSGSGGTDYAIHKAAGPKLDAVCEGLERLHVSGIAVTEGYGLPSKYIFHTVGPIWNGGNRNEEALLRGCYLNALFKAAELGMKSIAFPLISSGTFGFPKDRVLKIALTAIGNFLTLLDSELDVSICVFDSKSYEISMGLELERYLRFRQTPPMPYFSAPAKMEAPSPALRAETEPICEAKMEAMPSDSLDDWLSQQDDSFAVTLLKLIDNKNMTDVQCYKRANVSKKTFWKINNDPKYKPSKQTVIAFAIALQLDLNETENLLRTVGFSLSHSNTFDMIITFYIQHGIFDIYEINSALYKFDQVCLGC